MNTSATPLMSLEAVALDTETTGLDARNARIIEIAVLRMRGLRLSSEGALDLLVHPQCPIPPESIEIHGITDKDLRGAPEFRHVIEALDRRINDAVVIGHNIGYDLAVIEREYARAGIAWKVPRFLDVRALARLADPHLAGYGLRALCNWLEVDIVRRHRALPDALAAAKVFIALVPMLRACGIKTLAEAELACRALPGEERLYQVGGWIAPSQAVAAHTAPAIASVDSYPYRYRVRDIAFAQPLLVQATDTVKDVAAKISDGTARLAIVAPPNARVSVVTAADLLQASLMPGGASMTLKDIKRRWLPTISEDEFLYHVLGRMCRLNVSHIGVVNRSGAIIGTLSAADLLRHRVTSALILGDEIEAARTVPDLGRAWGKLPQIVATSIREEIEATKIAAIISAEVRVLTARAADLAEERMLVAAKGRPPCAYSVLVLGSAGRGDSTLSLDQDNALIFESGDAGGKEDVWFAEFGTHIADILHEVGVPYCPGGVMAKNPGCRHSREDWKKKVESWIQNPGPKSALASDIFFDAVPVSGDVAMADDLMNYSFARAEAASEFVASLAANARNWRPPLGILGRLITESDGRIDLKKNGLLPIVTAARTLALRNGIRPTSTMDRLSELKARSLVDANLIDSAATAFNTILRAIFAQQTEDAYRGMGLTARVDATAMNYKDRNAIITSMKSVSELIAVTLVA